MQLSGAVGAYCPNAPWDVRAVHQRLMEIGKIPCYSCSGMIDETVVKGIKEVQKHFMGRPDAVITLGGRTHGFLRDWKVKPIKVGVHLPGRLRTAWDLVNPLLPAGSVCTSGYRDATEQRRILHSFFNNKYRKKIIAKFGQAAYDAVKADLLANETKVLQMVRGVGQKISTPGKSMHQFYRAIDIGGPDNIDPIQVDVVRLVAHANPTLLSGVVIPEANGCVHFELR